MWVCICMSTHNQSSKDEELRHRIHMKMLSKSETAKDCGELTVVPLGHAVTIAMDLMLKAELQARIDEITNKLPVRRYTNNMVLTNLDLEKRLEALESALKQTKEPYSPQSETVTPTPDTSETNRNNSRNSTVQTREVTE